VQQTEMVDEVEFEKQLECLKGYNAQLASRGIETNTKWTGHTQSLYKPEFAMWHAFNFQDDRN
jgi:hypothetical protein